MKKNDDKSPYLEFSFIIKIINSLRHEDQTRLNTNGTFAQRDCVS